MPRGERLRYALSQTLILTSLGTGGAAESRPDLGWRHVCPTVRAFWLLRHGSGGSRETSLSGWLPLRPYVAPRIFLLLGAPREHAPGTLLTLARPSKPQRPELLQLCANPDVRHTWACVHTLTFNSHWPSRTLALPELTRAVRTPESLPQDTVISYHKGSIRIIRV